jgi:hypothetical protein
VDSIFEMISPGENEALLKGLEGNVDQDLRRVKK